MQKNGEETGYEASRTLLSMIKQTKNNDIMPKYTPLHPVQLTTKRPTSGGQTRDQEAAVQWTFQLQRTMQLLLSFGTNGKDLT